MKLRDWYHVKNGRLSALARGLGVSLQCIDSIARGLRRGRPDLLARISAATKGEVSIQEPLYPDGLPAGAAMCPACGETPATEPLPRPAAPASHAA